MCKSQKSMRPNRLTTFSVSNSNTPVHRPGNPGRVSPDDEYELWAQCILNFLFTSDDILRMHAYLPSTSSVVLASASHHHRQLRELKEQK